MKAEISKLKKFIAILENDSLDHDLMQNYFKWIIKGIEIEQVYPNQFTIAKKQILRYVKIPNTSTVEGITEYFLKIYDVWHPLRNNVETMDSIEEVRILFTKL